MALNLAEMLSWPEASRYLQTLEAAEHGFEIFLNLLSLSDLRGPQFQILIEQTKTEVLQVEAGSQHCCTCRAYLPALFGCRLDPGPPCGVTVEAPLASE